MISAGELISERVMLKRDRYFAVSARDGSMRPAEFSGDGVWSEDTRILSGFRLLVDGIEPDFASVTADDASATFELVAGPLRMTRVRFVESGLHERITIINRGASTVDALLEIQVQSDFAAMMAVRGAIPQLANPQPVEPQKTVAGVRFRNVDVAVSPQGLRHQVRLGPEDEFVLQVDVGPVVDFDAGMHAARDVYHRWAEDSMRVETDNPAVNELLDQAAADIRMLCNRYDTGLYPTGGLPWYAVPFGRDSLISSILLLPFNPELARGVLRYQALHQGRHADESTVEAPGKILHEVRSGEAVERGLWPHILYTTVDATALFMCTLAETETWTHDRRFADEMWPAAEAALEWCRSYGDIDGDGYIEDPGVRYHNAGWKDSFDSLTNVDGTDAVRPVALCEVQAYLHRGLIGMSRRRPALKEQAAALKWRFNRDFWMPKEGYFAQALDGSKRQVKAISSNPGHCLWMRIVDRPKAARVAQRMTSAELFSGWGIRTLSDRAVNYDPCSYHNGSVWPFDNALAIAGLRHYGYAEESERVARALLEASFDFPMHRPPELFCGDAREPDAPPREYWNTCTPQLWSAAAMFTCVSSILGLEADARRKTLRVAPIPTRLWNRVEVRGLHLAGQRLDFAVEGTEVTPARVPAGVTIAS